MILAALGDINGNFAALDAVLGAIGEGGIHTVLCTGNAVAGDSAVNAVVESLRSHDILCVQGEDDRRLVRFSRKQGRPARYLPPEKQAAVARAWEAIRSTHLEFLRCLPRRRRVAIDGIPILLCHGAPSSPSELLSEQTPLVRLQRQREAEPAAIIICGGAPRPFSRMVDGTLFVGPGFVDEAPGRACYTLVSTEEEPWKASVHYVEYPWQAG